jgi:serine/alanine adding enzyme
VLELKSASVAWTTAGRGYGVTKAAAGAALRRRFQAADANHPPDVLLPDATPFMSSIMPALDEPGAQNPSATVNVHRVSEFPQIRPEWDGFAERFGYAGFHQRLVWGEILHRAMGHEPYFLAARRGGTLTGVLPLVYVRSWLFGRFLVSLSYVNTAGVLSDCVESTRLLIDRAVELAQELQVRHLELRHEREVSHPRLTETITSKVHMRLALPSTAAELMAGFKSKLRSQVKKAMGNGQSVWWGGEELLDDFYAVFSRNMRDLGTPVFPRGLFAEMLRRLPDIAELCVLRQGDRPVAAAFLVHGPGTTQVPSASTIREFNATNANMRLYWHLLERSIERGQEWFDFGRSTVGSGTHRFKEQWGAEPHPAVWQYFRLVGHSGEMRVENPKYQRLITLWKGLPLAWANWLGPRVVRGIP